VEAFAAVLPAGSAGLVALVRLADSSDVFLFVGFTIKEKFQTLLGNLRAHYVAAFPKARKGKREDFVEFRS
jgi:hypothetical protein